MTADIVRDLSIEGDNVSGGGLGNRGKGMRDGGVAIGIAISSAGIETGESCRLIDLTS